MPSYGRWRRFKSVVPDSNNSRAKEISGGIKNALSRGETLVKAKQSFINSGYTLQEVQEAALFIKSEQSQAAKQLPTSPQVKASPLKQLFGKTKVSSSENSIKSSKKIFIILARVVAVVLAVAVILGLFWEKIF